MTYYQFNPDIVTTAQQQFVQQILDCKNYHQSNRLLGFSKGRGITWFLNTQTELGVNSVLRHYYRGGLFGKFVKDRYWFSDNKNTRAVQEFELLNQLHQWHLPTPRPIALKITAAFGFYQADILIEKIENTKDLSQFLQKNKLSAAQYQQIGKTIRQLHDHQVHHSDLNIHNILIEENSGNFWLIDFDKCQIQQGEEWKQANLARLLRSFNKEKGRLAIQFEEQDWQELVTAYHSN
ncbi:3-deoxy-D-manno-octulosonic acid kinase [Pasteurellaceae bacterium 15-036681]|nr:3-deoxy-D-manno-octulosonic acid kinase [Pasteurellaceae bacterium 15-036681]